MNLVYVCRSCDRDAVTPEGVIRSGAKLAQALRDTLEADPGIALEVREVACLNGCLKPCNIAFRGSDRHTYRFSRLEIGDLPSVIEFGRAYWGDATGNVGPDHVPTRLRAKLTVQTPPRGQW